MASTLLDDVVTGVAPPIVPITVEQLDLMLEAGVLGSGDPIELIDGLLVRKDRGAQGDDIMTHNARHALMIKKILRDLFPDGWAKNCHRQSQLPIVVNENSAPEPDVAVILGREEDFAADLPTASSVILVIEVAETSLRFDRSTKQRLYASAGIPEYWLINLRDDQIEIYREPDRTTGTFRSLAIVTPGQRLQWSSPSGMLIEIDASSLLNGP